MICWKCGQENEDNATFCTKCKSRLNVGDPSADSPWSKIVQKRRKRRHRFFKCAIVVLVIAAAIALAAPTPIFRYHMAKLLMGIGQYEYAITTFEGLGEYKNAEELTKEATFRYAQKLMAHVSPVKSIELLESLDGYGDSEELLADAREKQEKFLYYSRMQNMIAVSTQRTYGLRSDGTIVITPGYPFNEDRKGSLRFATNWTDIVAITAGFENAVGLRSDGTVFWTDGALDWTNIVAISAGRYHVVGLRADGTVVAMLRENFVDDADLQSICDVDDWTDIVAIAAGDNHTVGLRSDGTVVATGRNWNGECDTEHWTDIVAISAGGSHTVGLKADGTVVAVGWNSDGQCNTGNWSDIVAISAGDCHTVGLMSDGTVVAVGRNDDGQCDVSSWTNIIAVSAGFVHTVGLKSNGTMVATGRKGVFYGDVYLEDGQCNVEEFFDIGIDR